MIFFILAIWQIVKFIGKIKFIWGLWNRLLHMLYNLQAVSIWRGDKWWPLRAGQRGRGLPVQQGPFRQICCLVHVHRQRWKRCGRRKRRICYRYNRHLYIFLKITNYSKFKQILKCNIFKSFLDVYLSTSSQLIDVHCRLWAILRSLNTKNLQQLNTPRNLI